MDCLSAFKCSGGCQPWVEGRYGLLDCGDGFVCYFLVAWWIELYHDDPQYANKGNEHDKTSPDHLGDFLYSHVGRTFFSCTSFRVNITVIRPACRHQFLSV